MGERRRTRDGFTLVELIVVIAIIVILVGITVPSMSQFFKGQALESARRLLQSVGNTARQRAITSRKPHRIVFYQVEERKTRKVAARIYNVQDDEWVGGAYLFPSNITFAGDGNTLIDSGLYIYGPLIDDRLPDKTDMESGGKLFLEFGADGKPNSDAIAFQSPPVVDDVEITDPAWRGRELPAATPADLKLFHRGRRAVCLVYISPSSGRIQCRIVRATGALPNTVN